MASKRVRILLWVAGLAAVSAVVLTVSVALIIFRSIVSTPGGQPAATEAFEEIRRMFPGRTPLVTIGDIRRGDVRVNRVESAPRKKVDALHFIFWSPDDQKIVRGQAPPWVVRLRVSVLGIGDWSFSDLNVTLEDIERYAPGILLDFKTSDGEQVLVWAR